MDYTKGPSVVGIAGLLIWYVVLAYTAITSSHTANANGNNEVRVPVFSSLTDSIYFPVSSLSESRSGVVQFDLLRSTLKAVPMPCGVWYKGVALLENQGVLAAWGSRIKEGEIPTPNHPNRPQLIFSQTGDIFFYALLDTVPVRVHPDEPGSHIEDISSPEHDNYLYMAVRNDRISPNLPNTYLKRLDTTTNKEEIIWPDLGTYKTGFDDYFYSLSAPLWIEANGSVVFSGRPGRLNRRITVPPTEATLHTHWVLNPLTKNVSRYPQDYLLKGGWSVQKVDSELYLLVGAGSNPDGTFRYAIEQIDRFGHKRLLPFGVAPKWIFVFRRGAERVAVVLSAEGYIRLLRIEDGQETKRLSVTEILNTAPIAPCGDRN